MFDIVHAGRIEVLINAFMAINIIHLSTSKITKKNNSDLQSKIEILSMISKNRLNILSLNLRLKFR